MIEHKGTTIIPDPRPDLAYDSQEWTILLTLTHAKDPGVSGVLHGFRCGGLRFHKGGRGYALRPEFDPTTSIWAEEDAYKRDRDKWLAPHTDTIVWALGFMEQQERKSRPARRAG